MSITNAHTLFKELVATGFTENQAELLSGYIHDRSAYNNFAKEEQVDVLEKEQFDIKIDVAVIKQTVATKSDVADLKTELKTDIANLRRDMADLRTEFKSDMADLRTEFKTDIADLKTELKTDIADLRTDMADLKTELKSDVSRVKTDILQWMIPFFLAIIGLIISSFFK